MWIADSGADVRATCDPAGALDCVPKERGDAMMVGGMNPYQNASVDRVESNFVVINISKPLSTMWHTSRELE